MSEVILDTLIDSIKLVPFLFLTYLAMEYLEHKTSEKTEKMIKELLEELESPQDSDKKQNYYNMYKKNIL